MLPEVSYCVKHRVNVLNHINRAVNQKSDDEIQTVEVCTGTRAGEGKQMNGAATGLTHGPHSLPPPTSLCSFREKSSFCFSKRGGSEVFGVNRRSASPLRPPSKKKKRRKSSASPAQRPPSLSPCFSTQTQSHQKQHSCCCNCFPAT